MDQDNEGKPLDSLTEEEKGELDESLGPKIGPKPLANKEQHEIEEMAIGGEKPKPSAKPDEPKPPRPAPKPAPRPKPPVSAKPVKEKPKAWLPTPAKPPPRMKEAPVSAKKEELIAQRPKRTILGYLGYTVLGIVVLLVLIGGLSYADTQGWLPIGINKLCQNIGLEGGCLSFFGRPSASPSKEVAEIRQVFQSTTSHQFEATFTITLPAKVISDAIDQSQAAETETAIESRFITLGGRASGSSKGSGSETEIVLEGQKIQSQLWQEFIEKPIKVKQQESSLFLSANGLKFDGWVEVLESDFLSYLDFLTVTSGGIVDIKSEEVDSEMSKYILTVDPSSLTLEELGQISSIEVAVYATNDDHLPQEIDLNLQLSQGSIEIAKRYASFNAVQDGLTEPITAKRQLNTSRMIDLVKGLQSTVKERDRQRKEDLAQIQSALEAYQQAKGKYPTSAGLEQIDRAESTAAQGLVPDYISTIPGEPLTDRYYYGYKSDDGSKYFLVCVIESESDPDTVQAYGYNLYYLRSQ